MQNALPNRPTLDALRQMPVADLINLPADHLALLQSDARDALDAAKRMQELEDLARDIHRKVMSLKARAHFQQEQIAKLSEQLQRSHSQGWQGRRSGGKW